MEYLRRFVSGGRNYLGPGNELDNGVPVDYIDEVARRHDLDYSRIEKLLLGREDFREKIREADERAIEEFNKGGPSWGKFVGQLGLELKKLTEDIVGQQYPMPAIREEHRGSRRHGEAPYKMPRLDEPETQEQAPIQVPEVGSSEDVQMTEGVTGRGVGGGSVGGNGRDAIVDYRHFGNVDKIVRYAKRFLVTVDASNYEYVPLSFIDNAEKQLTCLVLPYSYIPIDSVATYLAPNEWMFLKASKSAKLLHVSGKLRYTGFRTKFTTNDTTVVDANSTTMGMITIAKRLEDLYPTAYEDSALTRPASLIKDYSRWIARLYGTTNVGDPNEASFDVPACMGTRKITYRYAWPLEKSAALATTLNTAMTAMPILENADIISTQDLKHTCPWSYNVRNGWIQIAPDIYGNQTYYSPGNSTALQQFWINTGVHTNTQRIQQFQPFNTSNTGNGLYTERKNMLDLGVTVGDRIWSDYQHSVVENMSTFTGNQQFIPRNLPTLAVGLQPIINDDGKPLKAQVDFIIETEAVVNLNHKLDYYSNHLDSIMERPHDWFINNNQFREGVSSYAQAFPGKVSSGLSTIVVSEPALVQKKQELSPQQERLLKQSGNEKLLKANLI